FNWPPGCAPTHCRNKSWYRTWLPNCAWAKDSHSKTLGKLSSKASIARSELMLLHGTLPEKLDAQVKCPCRSGCVTGAHGHRHRTQGEPGSARCPLPW